MPPQLKRNAHGGEFACGLALSADLRARVLAALRISPATGRPAVRQREVARLFQVSEGLVSKLVARFRTESLRAAARGHAEAAARCARDDAVGSGVTAAAHRETVACVDQSLPHQCDGGDCVHDRRIQCAGASAPVETPNTAVAANGGALLRQPPCRPSALRVSSDRHAASSLTVRTRALFLSRRRPPAVVAPSALPAARSTAAVQTR
jgi:hypothetical protein